MNKTVISRTEKSHQDLLNKVLSKKLDISKITQLSWSISQVDRMYPVSGTDEDLEALLNSYERIWDDFIYLAQKELGLTD